MEIAVNFRPAAREIIVIAVVVVEREEKERKYWCTVNGGKMEGHEGGKKSCAATFECRENDSSAESVSYAFCGRCTDEMLRHAHFEKRNKNERHALTSLD